MQFKVGNRGSPVDLLGSCCAPMGENRRMRTGKKRKRAGREFGEGVGGCMLG